MKKIAIVLAGGTGSRHGGPLPKQFAGINGRPVLWWSMKRFYDEDPTINIIVVMHPDFTGEWDRLTGELNETEKIPHYLCEGGGSRTDSVKNGLRFLHKLIGENNWEEMDVMVAIHDAARPMVSPELINRGWDVVSHGIGAVPVVESTSSLRLLKEEERGEPLEIRQSIPVDRSLIMEVQTPQIFSYTDLKIMYDGNLRESFTDDAGLAQLKGIAISLFKGDTENFKITNPRDSMIADFLLKEKG